jgi:hypothetical protein
MKKIVFVLILCLAVSSLALAQWRAATAEEIAFEKRISAEFEKILTAAAKKMSQPWTYQFNPAHQGPFDFDACDYIPHEVRVSMGLAFPPDSPDANRIEQDLIRYDQIKDSLAQSGKSYDRESPWDSMEVWVEIVVNYSALSQDARIDTTKLSANEKALPMPGAVLAIYQAYLGSSDRPTTRCWYGEIPFKNNPQTYPHYSPGHTINRCEVHNVILTVQTAPALAQEFYHNLDVATIKRIIEEQ